MKNKQLLSIALMLCVVSSTIFSSNETNQSNQSKRDNILTRAVAHSPISTVAGAYLMTKDFVHSQLGAYVPHAVAWDTEFPGATLFPSPRRDADLFSSNKKRYAKGVRYCIRYRNLGMGLLCVAIAQASSKTIS